MTSEPSGPSREGRAVAGLMRGGVANVGGSAISAVCQLGVVLLVTRMFSADAAGTLFAATAIFLIVVAIVELGVDQGLVRFIAWHRARGDHAELGPLLRTAIMPTIAASLVGAGILALFAPQIAGWFGPDVTGAVTSALRVLALAVPLAAMTDVLLAGTRGFGVMRPTVAIERIARPLLQPVAIVVIGLANGGLVALALAWAAPYALSAIAATVALRRLWAGHRPTPVRAGAEDAAAPAGSFWSYTAARALARVCQVLLQRLDVVLVAALLGAREAAIYTAATRCIAVGQLLNQAVQQVIQPRLAELLAVREHDLAQMVLRRTTVSLVALAWPGYLALIALSPWLMTIFGRGYEEGTATLVILAVAMLIATAAGPLDVVLLMAGRSTVSLVNMIAGLAIDVAGCLILLPRIGLTGAAWAWAAAIVVRNGLGVVVTKRSLHLTATSRELTIVSLWALAYCGLVQVPAGLWGAPTFLVALSILVGTIAYAAHVLRHRGLLGLPGSGGPNHLPRPPVVGNGHFASP